MMLLSYLNTHTRVYFSNCHLPTHSLTHLFNVHMHMYLAYFLSWQIFIIPSCICMHVHVQQCINIVTHCNGNLFLMSLEDSLYLMDVELIVLFIVVYRSERVTIT